MLKSSLIFAAYSRFHLFLPQLIAIMIDHRSIVKAFLPFVISSFLLFASLGLQAQDGKQLFNQKCASCHAIDKQLVGPALKGVEDRWPDKNQLYAWVRNSAKVVNSGYPRAIEVYNQFNKVQMTAFAELTDKDIDAILGYINAPPVVTSPTQTPT